MLMVYIPCKPCDWSIKFCLVAIDYNFVNFTLLQFSLIGIPKSKYMYIE